MRNAVLTLGYARQQMAVDPAAFLYKALQRIGAGRIAVMAPVFSRLQHRNPTGLGLLLLAVAGRPASLAKGSARGTDAHHSPRRIAALADAAIAMGDPEAAARLLEQSPAGALRLAEARLARYLGETSKALELAGKCGRRGRRLRRELQGELAVFTGGSPSVPAVEGYCGLPGRVLFVGTSSVPHTQSGYTRRTHAVLSAIRSQGWDVAAVTRIGYPVEVGRIRAADVDYVDGIPYHRILPWAAGHGLDARLQQQAGALARFVEEFRPRILHTTTDFTNATVVAAVARAYGIPWVYEVRGQLADSWAATRPASAVASEHYRNFVDSEARAARAADAVVTLGLRMRERLVAQGVRPQRMVLCPNAVGGAFEREPDDPRSVRADLGLEPDGEYVGTITSVVGYEGLDDLIRAVALLAPTRPRLRLLIVGDGVALAGLRKLAQEQGVSERCRFTGRVGTDAATQYHQALDVFVLPRKRLGVTMDVTPLKPVEASASGKPVVASDLPALREQVIDGVNGLLVPPEDPPGVAAAVAYLLDNPATARRMGAVGRSGVLAGQTWNCMARKYTRLYDSVLQCSDG